MIRDQIYTRLTEEFGEDVIEKSDEEFNEFFSVPADSWYKVAKYLKSDPDLFFDSLMCISGVDLGPREETMEVVYNLHSMRHLHKIDIKITGPRDETFRIPSVESIWRIADWHEREIYDMFGIVFDGHRNLKRLLLPDDWEGHPLRKDYEVQEYYHGIRVPKIKPKKLMP